MTVEVDGISIEMTAVCTSWSFRYTGKEPMRKRQCLRISKYFADMAELVPPDKMRPGDLGMPTRGIMQDGDLSALAALGEEPAE